jgi:hypothetical protein
VVRSGEDARLPLHIHRTSGADGNEVETAWSTHTFQNVYREMFMQVCVDVPSIGDFRVLTDAEIRFFYNGLRGRLKHATKPR